MNYSFFSKDIQQNLLVNFSCQMFLAKSTGIIVIDRSQLYRLEFHSGLSHWAELIGNFIDKSHRAESVGISFWSRVR